jgi:acylphosphatase
MDKGPWSADNESGMTVCKKVRYSGRVQGVGFRYTTQRVAEGFPVTGYVRNLPNGDVELVAEGSAEQVDAFLAAVARQMAGFIEQSSVQEEPPGGHKGFRIRH